MAKILVVLSNCFNFRMSMSLGDCFGNFNAYFEPEGKDEIESIDIEGENYEDVYSFQSTRNIVLYNSEKGFLKIENNTNNEIFYLISQ